MKRGLPFFSPVAVVLTLVVFAILGLAIWTSGGSGFSPGPVSAKSQPGVKLNGYSSHADFESNCGLCHQPLQTRQNTLCLDCHKDVNQQMVSQTGTHGHYPVTQHCAECHAEHKGRNFDSTQLALASFDHSQTAFPLTGLHQQVQCGDCHKQAQFSQVSMTCSGCHAEPEVHKGLFDSNCATCHTTTAWNPATLAGKPFDHSTLGFTLTHHQQDYAGKTIACTGCHSTQSLSNAKPVTTSLIAANQSARQTNFSSTFSFKQSDLSFCTDCHTQHDPPFMAKHVDLYGSACLDCHDGADRMAKFNHNNFFPLDGKHRGLDCTACHANHQFKGTPTQCVDCHAEPAIHAGNFGLACQYCHTTTAWNPALLRMHIFPIDHGTTGQLACQTCHVKSDAVYTCYSCHDHQPAEIQTSHLKVGISLADLPNCASCHPSGKVEKK